MVCDAGKEEETIIRLARVGYDFTIGYLKGGFEAWKVSAPKVGDTVAAVGFTFKDEQGAALARIEYLMVGEKLYGLRSMPV